MELSVFLEIVFSIIGAIIVTLIASWIVNKFSKGSNIGCSIGMFSGIIIFVLLNVFSASIIEVYDNEGKLDYKKRDYLGSYDYELPEGEKINLKRGDLYIVNKSQEILAYYPEYYGNSYNYYSGDDGTLIAPNSVVSIEHAPDYYFKPAPSSIRTKSKSETKWVLESLEDVAKREGYDLNDLEIDIDEINRINNSPLSQYE